MKHGKKYQAAVKTIGETSSYDVATALKLVKECSFAAFDETVELVIHVKLKKSQIIRDTFAFPHPFGTESRVLVFAEGEQAEEATAAGAAYVGAQDLIDKIKGGWLDFDVAVSTPSMMKSVAALGQILGRRGLMPNPKARTVTNELTATVQELKSGRLEFRSDKTGVVSLAVGKCSLEVTDLVDNVEHACKEILKRKPAETKGHFFHSATVCSTMGPGVPLDIATIA